MSQLILLYTYNSNTLTNIDLLNLINEISGISIIDINGLNKDIKVSNEGDFIIYYKGQSKKYEATKDNLNIIMNILQELNISK